MKAKKSLMAFSAIAALAMSSCTQEEDLFVSNDQSSYDGNAITFGTYLGKASESRGADMNLDALKKSEDGFGVLASYTGTESYLQGEGTAAAPWETPNFMYNQQVKWKTDANLPDGYWYYTPVKYWPNNTDEKLSFFAYAPYVGIPKDATVTEDGFISTGKNAGITGLTSNTSTSDPKLAFKMNDNVADQIDLLYADPMLDRTKQFYGEKVQLKFKHALSRIGFERVVVIDQPNSQGNGSYDVPNDGTDKIKLADGTSVVIKKVELYSDKFGETGKLNLRTGQWENVSSGPQTYRLTDDDMINNTLTVDNATEKLQLNHSSKYLMIMPSAFDENIEVTVSVEYEVITEDGNLASGESKITNNSSTRFPYHFSPGKTYNFVLHIGLTSVKLDATVEDWDDALYGHDDPDMKTEITVNIPHNNSFHLVIDANGGQFLDGSTTYVISKDLPDGVNSATFNIPDMFPDGNGSHGRVLGYDENKDTTVPHLQANSEVTVSKDSNGTATVYVIWEPAEGDD